MRPKARGGNTAAVLARSSCMNWVSFAFPATVLNTVPWTLVLNTRRPALVVEGWPGGHTTPPWEVLPALLAATAAGGKVYGSQLGLQPAQQRSRGAGGRPAQHVQHGWHSTASRPNVHNSSRETGAALARQWLP